MAGPILGPASAVSASREGSWSGSLQHRTTGFEPVARTISFQLMGNFHCLNLGGGQAGLMNCLRKPEYSTKAGGRFIADSSAGNA